MKENVILEKSYLFAIRIVGLSDYLQSKKAFVLKDQVLRSGTSIGANAEEFVGASSTKDFLAKANISYREARETHYWLRLLRDTGYITSHMADSMLTDCEELLKILGAIQKTMKRKLLD
ncbi:MAG TPA: four helix bundle protein [Candidatus Kapabacteria bacterium]|jgi:four helix bundle protein|nr:four helix bundle protein [Candidatus Kapabacteria bacterium]